VSFSLEKKERKNENTKRKKKKKKRRKKNFPSSLTFQRNSFLLVVDRSHSITTQNARPCGSS